MAFSDVRGAVSPELPRAPSLELCVLPIGGGQYIRKARTMPNRLILRSGERCYGADRDRTGDLCSAIAALSQLSYSPAFCAAPGSSRRRTMEKAPQLSGAAPDSVNLESGCVIRQVDAHRREVTNG